jgi:hypothetical protein
VRVPCVYIFEILSLPPINDLERSSPFGRAGIALSLQFPTEEHMRTTCTATVTFLATPNVHVTRGRLTQPSVMASHFGDPFTDLFSHVDNLDMVLP